MILRCIHKRGCDVCLPASSLLFAQTCRWLLASACLFLCSLAVNSQSITTDKLDYQPGETVVITGAGWWPGETVSMELVENPLICTSVTISSVADAAGGFINTDFSPDEHDVGVRFTIYATGLTSGLTTTAVFFDGGGDFSVDFVAVLLGFRK